MGRVICDKRGEVNDYGYVKCQKCGGKIAKLPRPQWRQWRRENI